MRMLQSSSGCYTSASVESLAEVNININYSSLIHHASYFITEDCQVSQVSFPFHKSTLTALNHLFVLSMFANGFQDYLFHFFPLGKDEADQFVASCFEWLLEKHSWPVKLSAQQQQTISIFISAICYIRAQRLHSKFLISLIISITKSSFWK